uniref:NAD-dependent epimerase/dehydratase family protein n=1 Tax=Algoriphagus sp. TaxID=1872435 RepID=UPI004047D57D
MIYVTGLSGFVGSSFQEKFNLNTIIKSGRGDLFDLDSVYAVIHLAGISEDRSSSFSFNEYFKVNTEYTIDLFNEFLDSNAEIFIFLSSVKAVSNDFEGELTEVSIPNPSSDYGKSKLLAENYILSKEIPFNKKVFILRPCVIYGPKMNKNLNLLYKFVSYDIPWPLGAFENKRSFCSIDNLLFILKCLLEDKDIPSGVYNVSDDDPLSTNELIRLISQAQNRKAKIWNMSRIWIKLVARFGDIVFSPFNSDRLIKLTSSFVVNNSKIKAAIGKPLPVKSREGLFNTFKSFNS